MVCGGSDWSVSFLFLDVKFSKGGFASTTLAFLRQSRKDRDLKTSSFSIRHPFVFGKSVSIRHSLLTSTANAVQLETPESLHKVLMPLVGVPTRGQQLA